MRGFTTRVGLSLAAASLCFLSIPVAMAADDSTGAPVSTSRFAACAVDPDVLEGETGEVTDPVDTIDDQVDPIPAPDSTDSTGDTSDPTETDPTWEIDPIPMPRPCWYGPIDVPVCRNWPVLIVDPPDITIEPQEPPFVDDTVEDTTDTTVEDTTDTTVEDTTDTTVEDTTDTTIEDTTDTTIEDTTDTTVEDTTDPTDTTIDWWGPPVVYCFMKDLPDPNRPLGISEDGSMSITGLSPDVLPADDSFDGGLITIYGTGFQPGSTVMIGEQECTGVEVIDEHTLTCDPADGAISVNDVVVTSPDGTTVTAPDALEFLDPAGFWVRPVYAYSSNPFERTLTPSTTVPLLDSAEELAAVDPTLAIPTFTG